MGLWALLCGAYRSGEYFPSRKYRTLGNVGKRTKCGVTKRVKLPVRSMLIYINPWMSVYMKSVLALTPARKSVTGYCPGPATLGT